MKGFVFGRPSPSTPPGTTLNKGFVFGSPSPSPHSPGTTLNERICIRQPLPQPTPSRDNPKWKDLYSAAPPQPTPSRDNPKWKDLYAAAPPPAHCIRQPQIQWFYDSVCNLQLQFTMMNEDDEDYKDDSMMINCIVCIIKLSCKFWWWRALMMIWPGAAWSTAFGEQLRRAALIGTALHIINVDFNNVDIDMIWLVWFDRLDSSTIVRILKLKWKDWLDWRLLLFAFCGAH